jgi:uncharacterized protein (TIGR03083 family)
VHPSRTTFLDAALTVADLVERVPPAAWFGPGLGVWDLRALIGHTSRSLITVATYVDRPSAAEDVETPEAYYARLTRAGAANTDAVAQRGRESGAALGDDPAAAFRALVATVAEALDRAGDDDLIETAAGGMRVAAYLPTRTFELVVHGGDVGSATGLPAAFAEPVLAEAAGLGARIAVELGYGPALLAALTGRVALPPGFSIV